MPTSSTIQITGTGSYVPSQVLTNRDLEKMVDTTDEWITTRPGIKERSVAANEEASSDLAMQTGKKVLGDAGGEADGIGFIMVATGTPDMFFPSTACFVQKALGIK